MYAQCRRLAAAGLGVGAAIVTGPVPKLQDALVRRDQLSQRFCAPPISCESRQHGDLRLLTGNAHPALAKRIASEMGAKLSPASVKTFKNGEIQVLLEETMRGCDVYIIQPTCNPDPNKALMELLIMLDGARRGGAERITAVLPMYGYARQDKKDRSRAPITGKLVADMLHMAGASRVITLDLHASQIQGFVNYPIDNLYAMPLLQRHITKTMGNMDDVVIVSPDAGGVKRAQYLASALGEIPLAIISKQRIRPGEVASMILVGEVKGKKCVLVDDMADTCGTLVFAAKILKEHGAREVHAAVTHGVFSGDALDKIAKSELSSVIVTDSIPMEGKAMECSKLTVLSVADLFARAIAGAHVDQSMESLFDA